MAGIRQGCAQAPALDIPIQAIRARQVGRFVSRRVQRRRCIVRSSHLVRRVAGRNQRRNRVPPLEVAIVAVDLAEATAIHPVVVWAVAVVWAAVAAVTRQAAVVVVRTSS